MGCGKLAEGFGLAKPPHSETCLALAWVGRGHHPCSYNSHLVAYGPWGREILLLLLPQPNSDDQVEALDNHGDITASFILFSLLLLLLPFPLRKCHGGICGTSYEVLAVPSVPLDHCRFPIVYFSMRMKTIN